MRVCAAEKSEAMASSSSNAPTNEVEQLKELHKKEILSASEFVRMVGEITKTNEERLAEAVAEIQEGHDIGSGKDSDDSSLLVGEDGMPELSSISGSFDDQQDDDMLDDERQSP